MLETILRWLGISFTSRAPHERWPEIMHWKKGDKFETLGAYCGQAFLVSITEDGSAYVTEGLGPGDISRPEKWAISALVGKNRSLRSRRISAEIKQSNEYMELINQFNLAFEELQRRDKQNGIAA